MPTENRSSITEMVSVPEGFMLVERSIWTEQQVEAATACITRLKGVPTMTDRALALAAMDAAQCTAPDIALSDLLPTVRNHRFHIEVRECEGCNHIGIDDAHKTLGACHECDWSGPEPVEDKCPGCERENVMAAACPDCGSRYVLAASKEFEIAAPQPHAEPTAWMVGTAIWWTKEEAERDAAATGLPIVGLGPMSGVTPEQHQGEPVVLPARCVSKLFSAHYVRGWNACLDEIAKLGPLYTHADPGEVERLRAALKFYADREHYHFESGKWDTVSGEPLNILWCGDEPDFIEDGSIARAALERQPS